MRLKCIANKIATRVYGKDSKCLVDSRVNEKLFDMRINALGKDSFLELRFYDNFVDVITARNLDIEKLLEILQDYSELISIRFIEDCVHCEYEEVLKTLGLERMHEYRYAVVPEGWSVDKAKEEYNF